MSLVEAVLLAAGSGIVSGLIAWGGVRVELLYMRRDLDHAHRRLDLVGAPESWRG